MKDQLDALVNQWNQSLKDLFDYDPERGSRFVTTGAGLRLDYSKHWIDQAVLEALSDILVDSHFAAMRDQLFGGEKVNVTEDRSVLHPALRAQANDIFHANRVSIVSDVLQARDQAYAFANQIRDGSLLGATGKKFTDVVNIGIGGSDLGPLMVSEALKPLIDGPRPHYVSNVDGAHLHDTIAALDPEATLFLIASKTFTTQETMHNASKAQQWISDTLGHRAIASHFAALSTNTEAAKAFGISDERMFGFWDWVGGRYSVWSTIGLSLMIALGPGVFDRFLNGAREMDLHFRESSLLSNIPVIMALLGVWYRNGFGLQTLAVLPYEQRLHRFQHISSKWKWNRTGNGSIGMAN